MLEITCAWGVKTPRGWYGMIFNDRIDVGLDRSYHVRDMIAQKRIDEIEQKARQVIGNHLGEIEDIDPPIDVARILRKEKIELNLASFDNPTIAGMYDKEKKAIYVDFTDKKTRQLFTVAHELGHYYLEPDKETEIFYRHQQNDFSESGGAEQEANWFAASLLMPEELVRKIWQENKNVQLIATKFGVSISAARWRLKNLKVSV